MYLCACSFTLTQPKTTLVSRLVIFRKFKREIYTPMIGEDHQKTGSIYMSLSKCNYSFEYIWVSKYIFFSI